jgi:hypothetical protein
LVCAAFCFDQSAALLGCFMAARIGPYLERGEKHVFRQMKWLVAGATAGALAISGGASALAAGGWTVTTVSGQPGDNVALNGVFARTSTDAWAVGTQFGPAGSAPQPGATYHWNGTSWSLIATPALGVNSALVGISDSGPSDAWAVGFEVFGYRGHKTLLEHWNGSAWSVDTADAISGGLGVELTAVLDLSPANAYAVGSGSGGPMIEHWNGTSWSPIALPDPDFTAGSGSQDISATSASDIWVVGSTTNPTTFASTPEALHFNGTAWTAVPMAEPGSDTASISAVAAISPANAWAVGEQAGTAAPIGGGTLTEHWNGTSWSVVPSPTPGADDSLTGVAGRSAGDVVAVGSALPSINGGPLQSVILRWNGTSWSDDTGGTIPGWLTAAAAFPGAAQEFAVGNSSGSSGQILSHS